MQPHRSLPAKTTRPKGSPWAQLRESLRHTRMTLALVWRSSPPQTVALGVLTLVGGLVPLGVAYAGKRIVDAVVTHDHAATLRWVVAELCLVVTIALVQRGLGLVRNVLGARLGIDINVSILEKALGLELRFFEDPEFYDKLTRARREASSRPIALVTTAFGLVQSVITLVGYGAPSVLGQKLVLHHRIDDEEVVECFAADTGQSASTGNVGDRSSSPVSSSRRQKSISCCGTSTWSIWLPRSRRTHQSSERTSRMTGMGGSLDENGTVV